MQMDPLQKTAGTPVNIAPMCLESELSFQLVVFSYRWEIVYLEIFLIFQVILFNARNIAAICYWCMLKLGKAKLVYPFFVTMEQTWFLFQW